MPPPAVASSSGRLLTIDIYGPADVGAAQRIGDLAGDGLEEEGVIHDGFIEVTGCFLYHLAFLRPPAGRGSRVALHCFPLASDSRGGMRTACAGRECSTPPLPTNTAGIPTTKTL